MSERDTERDDRASELVNDAHQAVQETKEILGHNDEDYEHSEYGKINKNDLAERRAWRTKVDAADPIEQKALQYASQMQDVRNAVKITAAKRRDEHFMGDLEAKARANQTTVPNELRKYVTLETQFAQDPRQGLLTLAGHMGRTPAELVEMLAPHAMQHPAMQQADAHQSARYNEALTIESHARQALGAEYKTLEPTIVQVLEHPNFQHQRTGDLRADLSRAVQLARAVHQRQRDNEQVARAQQHLAKAKRANRSLSGGDGSDYSDERPRGKDALEDIRSSVRKAMGSL